VLHQLAVGGSELAEVLGRPRGCRRRRLSAQRAAGRLATPIENATAIAERGTAPQAGSGSCRKPIAWDDNLERNQVIRRLDAEVHPTARRAAATAPPVPDNQTGARRKSARAISSRASARKNGLETQPAHCRLNVIDRNAAIWPRVAEFCGQ
jgi:hypothetical protein